MPAPGWLSSSVSRRSPASSFIRAVSFAERWSIHMMAGMTGSLFLSNATSPCIWPESPMPSSSSGLMPDFSMASRMAITVQSHHTCGSCSA